MQLLADAVDIRLNARDVRGRGECADHQRVHRSVPLQQARERGAVDASARVLGDAHHERRRLAPRQQVGVVLVRPDEHHGALRVRRALRERRKQAERTDQLVGGAGRAAAREEHHVGVAVGALHAAVGGARDRPARLLAEAGRLQAGRARGGVRVGQRGKHAIEHAPLDAAQRASVRRPVAVHGRPLAERRRHQRALANEPPPRRAERVGVWRISRAAVALTTADDDVSRGGRRDGAAGTAVGGPRARNVCGLRLGLNLRGRRRLPILLRVLCLRDRPSSGLQFRLGLRHHLRIGLEVGSGLRLLLVHHCTRLHLQLWHRVRRRRSRSSGRCRRLHRACGSVCGGRRWLVRGPGRHRGASRGAGGGC